MPATKSLKKVSQKEYLKKYLSGNKKKKKDKKHKLKNAGKVKIIDDDANLIPDLDIDEELLLTGEDAPQIVGTYIEENTNSDGKKWRSIVIKEEVNDGEEEMKCKVETAEDMWGPKAMDRKYKDEFSPIRRGETNSIPVPKPANKSIPSDVKDILNGQRRRSHSNERKKKHHKESSKKKQKKTKETKSTIPQSSHSTAVRHSLSSDQSPPRRRRRNSSEGERKARVKDQSPPRRRRRNSSEGGGRASVKDQSPPRRKRRNSSVEGGRASVKDQSPPRRRKRNSSERERRANVKDQSPPRRKRRDSQENSSAHRRRGRYSPGDKSPPRRKKKDNLEEPSPLRQVGRRSPRDQSPPRRRAKDKNEDHSRHRHRSRSRSAERASHGHRKHEGDRSPTRQRDSHSSPPRRRTSLKSPIRIKQENPSPDLSPKRNPNGHSEKETDRKLKQEPHSPPKLFSTVKDDKIKISERRTTRWEQRKSSRSISPPPSHKPKPIMTTLEGKRAGLQDAESLQQENLEFRRREDEMFAKMASEYSGRDAEVQVRGYGRRGRRAREAQELDPEEELRKEAHEKKKKELYDRWGRGLKQIEAHRAKIDEEMYEGSKPLARHSNDADLEQHLREQERTDDPMLEYMRKKRKDQQKHINVPTIPTYQGSYPENRFDLRPGYRWDGVDRSNGYEKKWFDKQNEKRATRDEAYMYSVEDM